MSSPLYNLREKLSQADDMLVANGIRSSELVGPDTFCYRVETMRRYDEVKQLIGYTAVLLDESMVAGRLIAVFEITGAQQLDGLDGRHYLELPQPKPDNRHREGIEHIQFVTSAPLERFLSTHSDIGWRLSGLEHNKLAELSGKDLNLKFHDKSLGDVIEAEKAAADYAQQREQL